MLAKWSLEVRIPAKELKNGANGQIKASWFFKTWNSISKQASFHEMFGGLVKQPPLLCKGLESSNWNNHETKWMCEVPGCYPTKSWNFKRLVLDSFPLLYGPKPTGSPLKIGRDASSHLFSGANLLTWFQGFQGFLAKQPLIKKSHPLRGSLGIAHFQVMIETKQLSHPKIQRKRFFLDAKNNV